MNHRQSTANNRSLKHFFTPSIKLLIVQPIYYCVPSAAQLLAAISSHLDSIRASYHKKLKRKRPEDSGAECTQEEPRFNDLLSSTCIIRPGSSPTERLVLVPNCAYEHILYPSPSLTLRYARPGTPICAGKLVSRANYSPRIVARCLPCKTTKLSLFLTRPFSITVLCTATTRLLTAR